MSENEEKILFSLTESVWFKQGIAVYDIRSLSLEPIVHIEEREESVAVRGYLQLYGEYDPDLSGYLEAEKNSLRDVTGERTIQEVAVGQNGVWTLRHQFPIDVDVPRDRVLNADDLSIRIQMFDYELLNARCLEIQADIEVSGIVSNNDTEQKPDKIRTVMEEDIPIYKTREPQIYAEMNARETEEVVLEEVNDQGLDAAVEGEIQANLVSDEQGFYIQPMPSVSRVDEVEELTENVEQIEEKNMTEIEDVNRRGEVNSIPMNEIQNEEVEIQAESHLELERPIAFTPITDEHEVKENRMEQDCEEGQGEAQAEWFTEEIPTLAALENRLQEMEEDIICYTDAWPPKPTIPSVFHFQSNSQPKENSNTEDTIERIDLSTFFLNEENGCHNMDSNVSEYEEEIAHEAVDNQAADFEAETIRKETTSGQGMPVEKYNLSGSPNKVDVEESGTAEAIQQIEVENIEEQPSTAEPKQAENALYLAKLFQSQDENRTKMKIYFVQKGDSVQSLAIRFNIPIHHIHKFNHLEDDELHVGDAIYIPTKIK